MRACFAIDTGAVITRRANWNLFSTETFTRAVEKIGYRVLAAKPTTGHAFWMYSFHHYVRYELGWRRLGAWLHPSRCVPGLAIVTSVDMVRARLARQTDNTLFVLQPS